MHTHLPASPVQFVAMPVSAGMARFSAPQPTQTAMLPSLHISSIPQSPLISALIAQPSARASRSRPLTLALRI
jgi:hypothetical protein